MNQDWLDANHVFDILDKSLNKLTNENKQIYTFQAYIMNRKMNVYELNYVQENNVYELN